MLLHIGKTSSLLNRSFLFVVLALVGFGSMSAHAQNWNLLSPANVPSPRSYLSMTYDGATHKVLLFGGFSAKGYLNDTWLFDGTAWKKVKTPVAPPVRTNARMAYDEVSHKVVLFGGYNGNSFLGDTWLWDGASLTWTEAHPLHSPPAVTGPMLFTDQNGHVDKFGGFDGNFYDATFWQWNGGTWKRLHPSTVPYARSIATVGFNPNLNQVVLFGGLAAVNPVNTWTYDGTTWTMQNVNTQPAWVYGGSGAFDSKLNSVILFGGGSGGVDLNKTWA